MQVSAAACLPSFQLWQPLSSGALHEPCAKFSSLGLGRKKAVMGLPVRDPTLRCPCAEKGWSVAWRRGELMPLAGAVGEEKAKYVWSQR